MNDVLVQNEKKVEDLIYEIHGVAMLATILKSDVCRLFVNKINKCMKEEKYE